MRKTLHNTDPYSNIKAGVWAERVNATTLIENILVKEKDGNGTHKKLYNRHPSFEKHLCGFGEVGVSAFADRKTRLKFANRGRVCIVMGYATNHAADMYRMLDLDSKRITISRDIRCLNESYSE